MRCELSGIQTPCPPQKKEERMARLDLLEGLDTATLQVDDVLGEISNKRNQLGDLRTAIQVRRDKTVGLLTTAALLTGSALGTVVTATQFSSLGSTAQNTGDGIGSGVLSTLFPSKPHGNRQVPAPLSVRAQTCWRPCWAAAPL